MSSEEAEQAAAALAPATVQYYVMGAVGEEGAPGEKETRPLVCSECQFLMNNDFLPRQTQEMDSPFYQDRPRTNLRKSHQNISLITWRYVSHTGNEWRYAPDFPLPAIPTPYFLHTDGVLQLERPAEAGSTPIVADPAARADNLTGAKNASFEPFYAENDHFTKTGSGQIMT